MTSDEKLRLLVTELKPKVENFADRILPYEPFFQYANAVLFFTCRQFIQIHPNLAIEQLRAEVLENTLTNIGNSAGILLQVLRTGKGQGRASLLCDGQEFVIDFSPAESL